MPSARPTAPRPSPRFGLTDTCTPWPIGRRTGSSASARLAAIAATCGASRGSSAAIDDVDVDRPTTARRAPARDVARAARSTTRPRYCSSRRREQRAEVGEPGRAEQRVGDRVRDDVGVGVADAAPARRSRRRRARAGRRRRTGGRRSPCPTRITTPLRRAEQRRDELEVAGRGDLQVAGLAGDDHDRCRPALRRARRRRCRRAPSACAAPQALGAERLRGLHRDEVVAGHGLDHPVAVDPLDRVGDRERPGPRRRRRAAPRRSPRRTARRSRAAARRRARRRCRRRRAPRRARRAPSPARVAPPGDRGCHRWPVPARVRRAARPRRRRSVRAAARTALVDEACVTDASELLRPAEARAASRPRRRSPRSPPRQYWPEGRGLGWRLGSGPRSTCSAAAERLRGSADRDTGRGAGEHDAAGARRDDRRHDERDRARADEVLAPVDHDHRAVVEVADALARVRPVRVSETVQATRRR